MLTRTLSHRRLILMTLGLTYITIGMLGTLPAASLVRLASNTHVSLEVAGGMFTVSAIGDLLGAALSGFLIRSIKPKYLLMLGLGINWVMAIPALCCAFICVPMMLANRAQPQGQTDHHDGSMPLK